MAQYDVDLRDYWRIIKKRFKTIILIVVLVGACSLLFAKLKEPPPEYKADAAIKIEQTSNLAAILSGSIWYQTESMVTHAYIVTSYPVLKKTGINLGWIPPELTDQEIQVSKTHRDKLAKLKAMSKAEHEAGTNIINIEVISRNKDETAKVANAISYAYQAYNKEVKNKITNDTRAFIEDRLAMTSGNLKRAEKDLKNFKEGVSLVSIDQQTRHILERLNQLETEYSAIQLKRKETASQVRLLEMMQTEMPGKYKDTLISVQEGSPVFRLKVKLNELMLQRQTLLIHFTEKHPKVIDTDDQIRAVIQETRKELMAHRSAIGTRGKELRKKIFELKKEYGALPEKAILFNRLKREVDLQAELYSQLKTKHQETLIQASGRLEEVSIVKPASTPGNPFNIPSSITIVLTGFVMGVILGIVFAFGAELFDTSMGTIEDVEDSLQVPVLGVIPFMEKEERERLGKEFSEKGRKSDLIIHYDPKSLAAEAFRSLRTNLEFTSVEIKGKLFLITSSFVQEGKTLNVINLALSTAQVGKKVLLIEADLRKPLVHKNFGLSQTPGLTDYVLGNYHWKEVVNNISDVMLGDLEIEDILRTPGLDNLNVITSGTRPPNPSEILGSARFREFLEEAKEEYDFIFIDSPPILPVADATTIAPFVDGVVLVYTVGRIARGVLRRAKSTLDNIDAKVLGVILNNVKPEVGPDYFKFQTQYYYSPEVETMPLGKKSLKEFFQKLSPEQLKGNYLWVTLVFVALFFLVIGVFWSSIF